MSLQPKAGAQKPPTPRINPEIDAKIDKFIAQNQGLYEALMKMPKVRLVRKVMLQKLNVSERAMKHTEDLRAVIDADPALKSQVDRAMERIPVERRQAAYRGVAQATLAKQAVRAAAPRVGG